MRLNEYPSKNYLASQIGVPIIDVRTKEEWLETGILKGSYTLTFFDEIGQFNLDNFLSRVLKLTGDKSNKFMLICRTGSRTGQISIYLSKLGFNVINLAGGITYVRSENSYEIVKYNSSYDL